MPVTTGLEASTGCAKGAVALRNHGGIVSRAEETVRSYLAFVQTGLQFYRLKELRSVRVTWPTAFMVSKKYWENSGRQWREVSRRRARV
jgi:hypothetical protein